MRYKKKTDKEEKVTNVISDQGCDGKERVIRRKWYGRENVYVNNNLFVIGIGLGQFVLLKYGHITCHIIT